MDISFSVLLPCGAHTECAYHKSPSAPDQNAVNTAKHPNLNHSTAPTSNYKIAPIQALPTELLLYIIASLTVSEQAFLALSCKRFLSVFGPSLFPKISKAKGATWRQHDEFLDALDPFLKDDYWRCPDCIQFHPRRANRVPHADPPKPPQRSKTRPLSFNRLLRKEINHLDRNLHLGLPSQPIYSLSHSLISSILHRHHNTPPAGTCLNELKCQGEQYISLTSPFSDIPCDIHIAYTYTSKIVLDRLLLRTKYSLRFQFPKDPLMTAQPTANRAYILILDRLYTTLPFYICAHTPLSAARISSLMAAVKVDQRCAYCATQYTARLTHPKPSRNRGDGPVFQYTVYQNFGQAGSKTEAQWAYFVQPMRKKRDLRWYQWGKEDIEQAFERIMCSTIEEFRRQLDRSDGMGSWYDPLLMRRVYKTLPASVALGIGGPA